MNSLLLDPYPHQAEIKNPYPGMVILVQNGECFQFQEVIRVEDGKAVLGPHVKGLSGTKETYLKHNQWNCYLVLEEVPLAEFLAMPEDTKVTATTFGHFDPDTFVFNSKAELLESYHLVSKDSIPR